MSNVELKEELLDETFMWNKYGVMIGYIKAPHAELVALRQASWINNDWRFNDCTLIVNLEPCPMCAGAAFWTRIGRIVYGAPDLKRGYNRWAVHPEKEGHGGARAFELGL